MVLPSIVVVPNLIFLGVWRFCGSVLQLSSPFPVVIAIGTVVVLFAGLFWWMNALQKKENEIIGNLSHPFFGNVLQKRKTWETTMTLPNLDAKDLSVSSYEGNVPTDIQRETVNWISGSFEKLTSQLEDCLDNFYEDADCLPPPRPRKLIFKALLLDPKESKTFCLMFDVEGTDLPWGFSAFYAEGELEDFTDNH